MSDHHLRLPLLSLTITGPTRLETYNAPTLLEFPKDPLPRELNLKLPTPPSLSLGTRTTNHTVTDSNKITGHETYRRISLHFGPT